MELGHAPPIAGHSLRNQPRSARAQRQTPPKPYGRQVERGAFASSRVSSCLCISILGAVNIPARRNPVAHVMPRKYLSPTQLADPDTTSRLRRHWA